MKEILKQKQDLEESLSNESRLLANLKDEKIQLEIAFENLGEDMKRVKKSTTQNLKS